VGHPAGQAGRREEIRSPLTLAADGMHSHFHNRYGITRQARRRKRWGVTGHLTRVRDLRPYIEVLYQGDSEIYLAPLAGDMALVAVLLEKDGMAAFRGDMAGAYHRFLKESPGFGPRVEDSEVIPPVGALGPMGYTVEPIYLAGLLLLGDSAGFIDAITGEGMTLALKSVEAAMPVIRRAFAAGDFGADLLAQYAVERARLVDDVARLTQLMLEVTRSNLLSNRAIRRLSKDEQLFQKLMGIVTGTSSYRDFTLKDRLALAMG
jgi:flavin-dependent dehydrogenase